MLGERSMRDNSKEVKFSVARANSRRPWHVV